MKNEIETIPSHQIDKTKWDECVSLSHSPLIYAHSVYLDFMADNWQGIVVNDYETVMPIPWRKKMGIRYVYDVAFIQQLGWFSINEKVNESLMLDTLFRFCKYGDYAFNYSNELEKNISVRHTNFIIDLSNPYSLVKSGYKTIFANNLKHAEKKFFIYAEEDPETAFYTCKELYLSRVPHISKYDYHNFALLLKQLLQSGKVVARKTCNSKNELLAVVLLLKDETRYYNIMNYTTEAGKKGCANHFLYDNIFMEFSNSGMRFDFEGSDITGIKNFYEGMGVAYQPYSVLHFNQLPFPINLIKR